MQPIRMFAIHVFFHLVHRVVTVAANIHERDYFQGGKPGSYSTINNILRSLDFIKVRASTVSTLSLSYVNTSLSIPKRADYIHDISNNAIWSARPSCKW
jgi:hypothetical protein